MKILETERLLLRTFQEDDDKSMIAINQDEKVMQFFPSVPTSEQNTHHFSVNHNGGYMANRNCFHSKRRLG